MSFIGPVYWITLQGIYDYLHKYDRPQLGGFGWNIELIFWRFITVYRESGELFAEIYYWLKSTLQNQSLSYSTLSYMWPLWQAWFQAFRSSYGWSTTLQHMIYAWHNPQPELEPQSRIRSWIWDLLHCLGMTLPVHGTSDYTGIRTSHVFRPGIEPGSTAWKSRILTTQPATHY